jgi:protocatechuate 3,4-dioxygenase beta subunit
LRHGHLRGWIKTDQTGTYAFHTIKPAPYPNSNNPAHIHPIVYEPDGSLYWIDEYLFEGDPFLTNKIRADQSGRGGSGIISLVKNASGEWEGRRDIILRKLVK